MTTMNHFTNKIGFNGIRSALAWRFVAAEPPDARPFGAYFTTLPENDPYLAARLGIPREKLEFVFVFSGADGLRPYRGGRGEYVFYSAEDYVVTRKRQLECRETRR